MASDAVEPDSTPYLRAKINEEMEYKTECALQETERWIQAVTNLGFKYPEDGRRSLENGVLFCELLKGLKPGCIRKINRLPSPHAGLDNITVFLEACQTEFGLKDSQLFNSCDLENLTIRGVLEEDEIKRETERRLRHVIITIFWLGRAAKKIPGVPQLDFTAFSDLLDTSSSFPRSSTSSFTGPPSELGDVFSPSQTSLCVGQGHTRHTSTDSWDRSSAYGSLSQRSEVTSKRESFSSETLDDVSSFHIRNDSYESHICDDFVSPREDTGERHVARNGSHHSNTDTMPVNYGSNSNDLADESLYAHTHSNMDGMYDTTKLQRLPRNRKDSSTSDSNDSTHMLHSPQGSDGLPTRNVSRRTSAPPVNPLQFVKPTSAPLSDQAREVIQVMEKQKEVKTKVQKEDEDWQSNLSNWKTKMRRKSAATYQRALNAEEVVKQQEEEDVEEGKRRMKSYKEKMQDREKKFNILSYPLDDEDDSPFVPTSKKTNEEEKLEAMGFSRDDPTSTSKSRGTENRDKFGVRKTFAAERDLEYSSSIPGRRSYGIDAGHPERDIGLTNMGGNLSRKVNDNDPPEKLHLPKSEDSQMAWAWENQKASPHESEMVTGWARSPTAEHKLESTPVMKSAPPHSPPERDTNPTIPLTYNSPSLKTSLPAQPIVVKSSDSLSLQSESPAAKGRSLNNSFGLGIKADFQRSPSPIRKVPGPRDFLKNQTPPQDQTDSQTEKSSTQKKEQQSEKTKKYIDKIIKISQKPNHGKGFGFTIKGGKEFAQPVIVEKVILDLTDCFGGAADVCELMPGDEIVSINGAEVANHYQDSVTLVIDHAVRAGQIELRIRRPVDEALLDDMEDDFELEEERITSSKHASLMLNGVQGRECAPSPTESVESIDSAEERKVMEQLEEEERLEHALSQQQLADTEANKEIMFEMPPGPEMPPPLPSQPPPPPNWTTFPNKGPRLSTDSFFDPTDLLPDGANLTVDPGHDLGSEPLNDEDEDPTTKLRTDILRKKSEFLGLRVEDTEEYKKIKEDPPWAIVPKKEREIKEREEMEWQRIELSQRGGALQQEADLDEKEQLLINQLERNARDQPYQHGQREDDLYRDQQVSHVTASDKAYEDHMIQPCEKEPTDECFSHHRHYDESAEEGWVCEPFDKVDSSNECMNEKETCQLTLEERVAAEFGSLLMAREPAYKSVSTTESFDRNKERERMEAWVKEQERMIQEQFEKGQKEIEQLHREDLSYAQEIEALKRQQEQELLERELAHQRDLEEMKRKRDEERRQREIEAEEMLRNERRAAAQARAREADMERERVKKEEERNLAARQKERNQLAAERAKRQQEEEEEQKRHAEAKRRREEEMRRQEEERIRFDEERRREEALRRHEEEKERHEDERQRLEEQKRRDEKRRLEEERQVEEQKIARKREELKLLEEKVRREEEELRKERERLLKEKEQLYNSPPRQYHSDNPYKVHMPAEEALSQKARQDKLLPSADRPPDASVLAKQPPPVLKKPMKKEPAIPAKPSIRAEMMSRRDIIEMNKRPTGRLLDNDSSQVKVTGSDPQRSQPSREEMLRMNRQAVVSTGGSDWYDPPVKTRQQQQPSMTREERMRQRRSWHEPSPSRDLQQSPTHPSADSNQQMTRKALHNLGAIPKPRLVSGNNWISASQEDGSRYPDIMKDSISHPSQHWLVEEAERRRVAEKTGVERVLEPRQANVHGHYPATSGASHQTGPSYPVNSSSNHDRPQRPQQYSNRNHRTPDKNSRERHSYAPPSSSQISMYTNHQRPGSTSMLPGHHLRPNEVEIPVYDDAKSLKPLPGVIKQTLIDRVTSPRDSTASFSSLYSAPPGYNYHHDTNYPPGRHQIPVNGNHPSGRVNGDNHLPVRNQTPTHRNYTPIPSRDQIPMTNYPPRRDHLPLVNNTPVRNNTPGDRYNAPARRSYAPDNHNYTPVGPTPTSPPVVRTPHTRYNQNLQNEGIYASPNNRSITPHTQPAFTSPPPQRKPIGRYLGEPYSADHARTPSQSSGQSSERTPPVPPKPPRLLAASSLNDGVPIEEMFSVRGDQTCSHCDGMLGHGAAMIIESLQLYYHVPCFCCYVCQSSLGSGQLGTNVRVRGSKLHCLNCYSNDEVGLKYSKV